MKKILSLILCVISLLNLLVVGAMPIYAEASVNLDDHLVVHYDFKGATISEALADKATSGDVDDNLVAFTPNNKQAFNVEGTALVGVPDAVDSENFKNSFDVDIVNGTATNLTSSASLQAYTSTDIQKLAGTATWFFRFKIKDVDAGCFTYPVDMFQNNKGGRLVKFWVDAGGNIYASAGRNNNNNATKNYMFTNDGNKLVADDLYINFAVTMTLVDGRMNYTSYFSTGTPTDTTEWSEFATYESTEFKTNALKTVPLSLFGRFDCAGENNTGLTLDDIRLYDTVLTKDQVATIIPTGLQKDVFAFDTGDVGFSMMEGAKIRLNEVTGIRFESNLDAAAYNSLVATYGVENVKYGTLIAPKSYFEEVGAMTFEALEKLDKSVKYLKVEAGAFYKTDSTVNTIAGSIANIDERNYTANYTAIGYIEITAGEDTYYLYADAPQTRSIAQVAEAAVNDRMKTEGVEGYSNKIEDGNANGDYSPYDKDQIAILKTFY